MGINGPPRPSNHPDRFLDAQEAIEDEVLSLVDRAAAAGWAEVEAVAAIVAVAEHRMLALGKNAELDEILRRLNL